MEALRSAEALKVHWDAAHSSAGAAAAAGPVQPAKTIVTPVGGSGASTPQMARQDGGKGEEKGGEVGPSGGTFVPQLPPEGSADELNEYKLMVTKMTEMINVRQRVKTREK